MHIDDYFFDDDDLDTNIIDDSDFASSHYDDNDIFDNEDLVIDEIIKEYHKNDISFCKHDTLPQDANSDGYIPSGHQELTSTVSDIPKTFELYSKGGHKYVLCSGKYYQIDGTGTVTIGGIRYDKI